jgi:uncharacterized phage protein (TIGR02218 family)
LAAVTNDTPSLFVFDTTTWALVTANAEAENHGMLLSVQFSPDSSKLALCGWLVEVYMLDTTTWELVEDVPSGIDTWVFCQEFSPDGAFLFVGGQASSTNPGITVFRTSDWEVVFAYGQGTNERFTKAQWAKDGSRIFCSRQDAPYFIVFDTGSWEIIPDTPQLTGIVASLSLSPATSVDLKGRFIAITHRTQGQSGGYVLTMICAEALVVIDQPPLVAMIRFDSERSHKCAFSLEGNKFAVVGQYSYEEEGQGYPLIDVFHLPGTSPNEYGPGGDNPFIFGLTTLDRDVVYQGVTYSAVNGFDPSMLATDMGLGVDNSEGYALLAGEVPGITSQMVKAGILDDAVWEMLLINYEDTSMGHVLLDAGDVGEVKVIDDTVFVPELLSYAMRLHQPIGDVWSINCRAIFGTPPDSPKGCGKSTQGTWESGEVTGLGAEDKFNLIYGSEPPIPGRLKWTSGDNQSDRLYQIHSYDEETGITVLVEGTPYPVAVGDTFDIRPDCDHTPAMCKSYGNWLNFKGEPLIPTTEGNDVLTPGVQV